MKNSYWLKNDLQKVTGHGLLSVIGEKSERQMPKGSSNAA